MRTAARALAASALLVLGLSRAGAVSVLSPKIEITPPSSPAGAPVTVTLTPEFPNLNACVNPFVNLVVKKFDPGTGESGAFMGWFDDQMLALADGTYRLPLHTFDWEPGFYRVEVYEKAPYGGTAQSLPFQVTPKDPAAEDGILAAMAGKVLGVFDGDTQAPLASAPPGAHVVVALNTGGLEAYRNGVSVDLDHPALGLRRLHDLRIDHENALNADVAPPSGKIYLQHLLLPVQPHQNIAGTVQVRAKVKAPGAAWSDAQAAFALNDAAAPAPLPVNAGAPLETFTVGLLYYGDTWTPEQLETLRQNLEAYFPVAAKKHFSLKVKLVGSFPLPPDNSGSPAQPGHPYKAWWDALPHDVSGTPFSVPLPGEPFFEEKIRYLWYYYGGLDPNAGDLPIFEKGLFLVQKEIEALYAPGTNGEDYLMVLTDAGFNGIGGYIQGSKYMMFKTFSAGAWIYSSGGVQNFKNPSWELTEDIFTTNVGLHELGHALWQPVKFPDLETIRFPFSFAFHFVDYHGEANLNPNDLMSYARDRFTLEGQAYGDRWLSRAIAWWQAPKIVWTNLPDKMKGASIAANMVVRFDKPMNPAAVQSAFSTIPPTTGAFTWKKGDTELWYKADGYLLEGTTYQVKILPGAAAKDGKTLKSPALWGFTTHVY